MTFRDFAQKMNESLWWENEGRFEIVREIIFYKEKIETDFTGSIQINMPPVDSIRVWSPLLTPVIF